jgi:hypothetical protein
MKTLDSEDLAINDCVNNFLAGAKNHLNDHLIKACECFMKAEFYRSIANNCSLETSLFCAEMKGMAFLLGDFPKLQAGSSFGRAGVVSTHYGSFITSSPDN